jgi:hypothetical protein
MSIRYELKERLAAISLQSSVKAKKHKYFVGRALPAVLLVYVLPSVGQCPTYVITLRPMTND